VNGLRGDWQRTVYIDSLGVGTTDFDLGDQRKDDLVKSGANGLTNYAKWYDAAKPQELPTNHPDFAL
jgi:NTE family protein